MELDDTEETQPVNDNKRAQVAAAKLQNQLPQAAKPEPAKKPEPAAGAQAAKVELVQTAEGLKAELPNAHLPHRQQARTVRIKLKPRLLPSISSVRKLEKSSSRSKYESFPRHGTSGQNSWLSLTSGCWELFH